MRTLPVRFSPDAERDMDDIEWWIADQARSEAVARSYGRRVRRRCERIGSAPRGGRARRAVGQDVRSVPFERSAVIFYRVEADRVLILRILRRGRDVERALTP